MGCGSWTRWGSCRAELVVIAAAALLMAQHLVRFTQLHKAAVQGWVPGVPVRVQLGWGRTPLISLPMTYPDNILPHIIPRGPPWAVTLTLRPAHPSRRPESQEAQTPAPSPCSSPPHLLPGSHWMPWSQLSQEQAGQENQAQPIRQDSWLLPHSLSFHLARPLPLGQLPLPMNAEGMCTGQSEPLSSIPENLERTPSGSDFPSPTPLKTTGTSLDLEKKARLTSSALAPGCTPNSS